MRSEGESRGLDVDLLDVVNKVDVSLQRSRELAGFQCSQRNDAD